LKGALVSL